VLDVGAGTGTDAWWLARAGQIVLAVQPTFALRTAGQQLHPHERIEWLDDALPDLARVEARGELWSLVLLSAVWMHLAAPQRAMAMAGVARLLSGDGKVFLSLRHGPMPPGRCMFEVSAKEAVSLAQSAGLKPLLVARSESMQAVNRDAGFTWSRIVLAR
jgi:2-polyprenyl-3-methyl-5-hydroxy-6-metoxy-1,4-benzoquinol methylase